MRMPSRTSLRCSWVLPPVARARVSSTEVIPVLRVRSLLDVRAMQSFSFQRYIMVGTIRSQFLRRGIREAVFILALARDISRAYRTQSQRACARRSHRHRSDEG